MTETLDIKNGICKIYRNYLSTDEANTLFNQLEQNIPWSKSDLKLYGKTLQTPRFQCWMGDSTVNAEVYSNTRIDWDSDILHLKQRIEQDLQFKFNYLLLNLYKTGKDYISYHSDNEVLQSTDLIGSLSLNGPRRFLIQHKSNKKEIIETMVNNGDLMIMDGEMQKYYKHSVPKTTRQVNARINLTFRKAKTAPIMTLAL